MDTYYYPHITKAIQHLLIGLQHLPNSREFQSKVLSQMLCFSSASALKERASYIIVKYQIYYHQIIAQRQSILQNLMFWAYQQNIDNFILMSQRVAELNAFRINPLILKEPLQIRRKCINKNGLLFSPKHPNRSIRTQQGIIPYTQLAGQFYNERELHQYSYNRSLSLCAQFIANSYVQQKISEPVFLQNISHQIRAQLNADAQYSFPDTVKCIMGVGFNQQYEPLLSILASDGDSQRTKRKILLSNSFRYCGAGSIVFQESSLICAVYLLTSRIDKKP